MAQRDMNVLGKLAEYSVIAAVALWFAVIVWSRSLSLQLTHWRIPNYLWWITFILVIVLPALALFNAELARRKKSYGKSLLMSLPVILLGAAELMGSAILLRR